MVADRPYRVPLGSAEALAELRRCAGEQFDPEAVEAFAEALREVSRRSAPAVA
jgi:HD-GYP domain-containing protein (c-di-GMP phosphodiesterase class II)